MTFLNPYSDNPPGPQDFGRSSRLVVPSDNADLPVVSKGLVIAAAGNVSFIPMSNADDTPVSLSSVSSGLILPWFVRRVLSTGTTATCYTVED